MTGWKFHLIRVDIETRRYEMSTAALIEVIKNTNNSSDEIAQRHNERARRILRKRGIFAI